ncbi:hypothetical protein [Sphaerisporangium perillae]|uniref:hypothetical protein n=1 Tax=Sphaerisporangium perillae TaxID=2935860 RepID=UPI00200D1588|nr:hypothetical protein [Sphaerisporangium perillae]
MILGLDAGSRTVAEAEHLLHDVVEVLGLPPGTVGCTHFVRTATGLPHVACSLTTGEPAREATSGGAAGLGTLTADLGSLPGDLGTALGDLGTALGDLGTALGDARTGPADLAEGAALAAAERASGSGGRLVLYPGRAELTGTLTVADVLARSVIDRIVVLGEPEAPSPDTPVATNDHVRPQWRDGQVVLLAMPASGERLMPAEVPDPTPCLRRPRVTGGEVT